MDRTGRTASDGFDAAVLPFNMKEHLNELEAYTDIQDFHDLCNLGNIGTGTTFPQSVVQEACRKARRLGVECVEPEDPTPKEAMNFIAGLIAKVEAQNSPGLLLSKKEVCKLLNISTRTFDRMKSAGEVPAPITIKNRKKWLRQDIIEHFGLE